MGKRCKHCRKTFTSNRPNQVYCSPACRVGQAEKQKKATRSKRRAKKLELLGLSNFGNYLAKECIRAGTVEILCDHTIDSLNELLALTKLRTNLSGMSDGKCLQLYELSHIHPVKSDEQFGLLHPTNLVIAPRAFNRSRGTSYTSGGAYLPTTRQRQFRVNEDTSTSEVIALIHKYLGSTLADFLGQAKLLKSTRNQQITRLTKLKEKTIPAPSAIALASYSASLKALSKQALAEVVEASGAIIWSGDRGSAPELSVALRELQRLQPDSPLIPIIQSLEWTGALSIECADPHDCLAFILKQCWLSLHGDNYSISYKNIPLQDILTEPTQLVTDF